MTGDIFSYILLAGIVGGGIWGITVKVREFSSFVKTNGWEPVKKKMRDFFITILRVTIYTLVGIGYLSGFVLIPLYFEGMLENESWTNSFILAYILFGLLAFYYVNGIKRKKTKRITAILKSDFDDFKKGLKEFIQGIGTLAKGLLILAGWLLAIGAIILAFVLFGWLIASLSATTIVIILLVLILLK